MSDKDSSASKIIGLLGLATMIVGVSFAIYKSKQEHSVSSKYKITKLDPLPSQMKSASSGGEDSGDIAKFIVPTSELIEKGKGIFAVNCASCHGAQGLGNGPAAAAMNPKPRNFHDGDPWKNGRTPLALWKTLQEGIAGGSMASFSYLSVQDRWSVIHYIRANYMKNPPADSPEALAALGAGATKDEGPKVEPIPIYQAMEDLAEKTVRGASVGPKAVALPQELQGHPGLRYYEQRCVSCHGVSGEGGLKGVGINPHTVIAIPSFGSFEGSYAEFKAFMIKGAPGKTHPQQTDLSEGQIQALGDLVSKLAQLHR